MGSVRWSTGGASGLGEATTRALAARGAAVTILDLTRSRAGAGRRAGRAQLRPHRRDRRGRVQAAIGAARKDRRSVSPSTAPGSDGRSARSAKAGPRPRVVRDGHGQPGRHVQRPAAGRRRDGENEPGDDGERGVIVNTASIAAYDGQIGQIAYAASKGGVVGLTLPPRGTWRARRPRLHDRPGPVRHALAGRAARGGAAGAGRRRSLPVAPGPARRLRAAGLPIVENPMLNGEVIRMDGALRMPPR